MGLFRRQMGSKSDAAKASAQVSDASKKMAKEASAAPSDAKIVDSKKDAEEKRNIFIPFPLSVHHANWCTGIENKMHLLDFVASRVQGRKSSR